MACFTGWLGKAFKAKPVQASARAVISAPPVGQVWKNYVFAGSARIAVSTFANGSTTGTVTFLIADHLGSLSAVADMNGNLVGQMRYTAFGEVRMGSLSATNYTYTGQLSQMDQVGLMFYRSRWMDPVTSHFTQADTLVPNTYNPSAWDRYSYVGGNPINRTDPTGHMQCDNKNGIDQCNPQSIKRDPRKPYTELELTYMSAGAITNAIHKSFGIVMQGSDFSWGKANLMTAYKALTIINIQLNGHLKSMVGGTTFTMTSQGQCSRDDGSMFNCYHGITNPTGVTYYATTSSTVIPEINFLHETGHLIDFVPATADVFSGPLNDVTPTWVKDGYVNRELLGDKYYEPVQSKPMNEPSSPNEYWADAFANYVAGNIDLEEKTGEGMNMYNFVYRALNPYVNP